METIFDVADFAGLRQEWTELLQSSDSDGLFLTWEWLCTWWKYLAAGRQLSIIAVRCEGVLIALAPCCLSSASVIHRRLLPVLELLGSGFAGSDYLDVIVRRGHEAESRQALSSRLASERLVLKWTQLKRGDCSAAGVAAALVGNGWSVAETLTNICPYIPLVGMTWESYLATLGAEHRYNFHRKWKRLNRDYSVSFEQVRTQAQCRESIGLVIAQHNLRWRSRGGSDAFHTSALVEFHREFSQIALERGWLRLYVLRLDGKPAASLYGFLYRRKFYFYQSGLDAAYDKYSAGLVTMGLAIKSAIEEGAEEYDLLHGNEAYKSHWSCNSRGLSRLEIYPPGAFGWLCRSLMEVERSARTMARHMLPKGVLA
jgi:CelD/BcsL family acetyltransferase involved in cellulose biosynthesis